MFNAKKQFMNWTEDIVVFYDKMPTFNPQMRTDGQFSQAKIQRFNTDRSKGTLGKTGERKDYVHQSNNGFFILKRCWSSQTCIMVSRGYTLHRNLLRY